MAHTHQQWRPRGEVSQLDYILGPKANLCDTHIWNKEKVCSTWDHYPVCAIIHKQEEDGWSTVKKRRREWTGWRPQDDEQEEKFKQIVLQRGDEETLECLVTIYENIESAAKEIAHTTQKARDSNKKRMPRTVLLGDAAAARSSPPKEEKCKGEGQRKPEWNTLFDAALCREKRRTEDSPWKNYV